MSSSRSRRIVCAAVKRKLSGVSLFYNGAAPKPPLLPPRQARADRLLPAGEQPQWYVRRFLEEFGVEPGEIGLFRDAAGEYLAIGEALFRDRHRDYKALKRGRERHVLLLADTIRSPD